MAQTYSIFVYGTLRKDGLNHVFMQKAVLLKTNYCLSGYRLYDYNHWYPYMIESHPEDIVTGEVYRIDEATLEALNKLEDIEHQVYRLVYLPAHQCYTYLKFDQDVSGLLPIAGGDWISYIQKIHKG